MAISKVRAKLGKSWTVLSYNNSTKLYEGTITPNESSKGQTGGYFPITIEATDDNGNSSTISGESDESLRFIVDPIEVTQIRAKLGNTWTTLSYHTSTNRYEGTFTPNQTSANQTGGYFPVTVEATLSNGEKQTLTGESDSSLRLFVKEKTSPFLSLISPKNDYITDTTTTFVFSATDEVGGSGIDASTAYVSMDGVRVSCSVSGSGYACTITATIRNIQSGRHFIKVRIYDRDGNEGSFSKYFTLDTEPPFIEIYSVDQIQFIDTPTFAIEGRILDEISPIQSITISGRQINFDKTSKEVFIKEVYPLVPGNRSMKIIATDAAGNSSTHTIWLLKLITDRTYQCVSRLKELIQKSYSDLTSSEIDLWMHYGISNADRPKAGAYNYEDMIRVEVAVNSLQTRLKSAGYGVDVSYPTSWKIGDIPTILQWKKYIENISQIKSILHVSSPSLPYYSSKINHWDANNIEKVLLNADYNFRMMERTGWQSGEIMSGEM